tara:strand:- start:857 stop:1912 length:1056 start_codon:yes stop_codon:yes gene_type:complete
MALPALNATFASVADLPRRQMLAKWLVGELGSGSVADYWLIPERYLWAKIAVAAGGPKTEATYISLPTRYVWSDIYNAVAGSSGSRIDWSEKEALGRIAAAYRGDINNPANTATYIDWPWRYKVASIIGGVAPPAPIDPYAMNVSLLLHMDGTNSSTTFIDDSINNLTVTAYGDVQISTTNKVFGTGSALFDGNGDYLEITDIAPFEFGSEDFTIEFWAYMVEGAGGTTIARWGGENAFFILVNTSEGIVVYLNGPNIPEVTGGTITPDEWHHVCLVRNGNNLKSFIDGQQVGTTATFTGPIEPSSTTLRIGWDSGANTPFNGHIDELRISKGVARYTENFTPQTASFPNP